MKANELRIGNAVFYDNNKPHEVSAGDLVVMDNFPDDYKPIPLTEEWLVKFGFYKKGTHTFLHNNLSIIIFKNEQGKFSAYVESDDSYLHTLLRHIDFVHELQNLSFIIDNFEICLK